MDHSKARSTTELQEENSALKERLEILEREIKSWRGPELDERLEIEKALAACSHLFAQPGDVNIENILKLIGHALRAHRATIYQFESDTLIGHYNYEWCAPGTPSRMQELKTLDFRCFPWLLARVVNDGVINIMDTSALPPEAQPESDGLISAEVCSMVIVPIYNYANVMIGWMGFADRTRPRAWKDEDIICIQIVAQMLGIYWERKRAEEEILHRLAIEEVIAECSRLLVGDSEADYLQLLEIVGRGVNAQRVCIYQFGLDNVAAVRHEWCEAGTLPLEKEFRTLDFSRYPWALNNIQTDQVLIIESPDKLSRAASSEKETLQRSDVQSMLSVPIWDSERKLKALMGYADTCTPRKWHNDDLRCLRIVAEMVGSYWERVMAREQVLHRLVVEEAIAEASRCFLQTDEPDINEIIKLIGTVVKANRAYVFEINEQTGMVDCTYEWCDDTTEPHMHLLKDLGSESIDWWANQLMAGKTIVIPEIDWASPDFIAEKEVLLEMDAKSLVMVPIFGANHRPLASLGFDDVQGRKIWLDEDIRCLQMVGGMLGAYMERRENEMLLRHSESRFRLLADITPAFTYITNLQPVNPLLFLNSAGCSLSGYTPEEIKNMNPWNIYHPDDRPILLERGLARMRGEEVTHNYEVRYFRKDGSIGYGLMNSAKIEWEGEPALISVVHDITDQKSLLQELSEARDHLELMVIERTSDLMKVNKDLYLEINERKQIEQELRESEANFKKLAETSPALIFVIDDKNLLYINSVGEHMIGYSRDQIVGKSFIHLLHDDYKDIFDKFGIPRLNGQDIPPYEVKMLRHDGTEIWGILSADIIEVEGSRCIIGAILDITEYKKMEEELMARERLETLGLMAGGIAHDFNNILTVISGNASLAQMIWEGDEEAEILMLLDDIKTASLQATHLTSQLLTFSKGGAPMKQSLPVQELVMESARFALAGSGFKCTFSFAEDLWAIHVDREQMSQVIRHLVSNACQAMPQGGEIRLEVENLQLTEAGRGLEPGIYIRIAVIDQGHGID
ncbi:MAG: PAS domain S-box protein, partial [Syntrophomonadaceae bacterium]|nr:PAS domain S-box protein [Syntrophomonadaceae bacterium]